MDMRAILIKQYDIPALMRKIENSPNALRYARLWRFLDRIRFDLTETGVVIPQKSE